MKKYAFFPGCLIPARFPQFEASSVKVLEKLGVILERIDGWTCCPEPTSMQVVNKETWYAVAARNICLAEERGLDILTLCNGCNETLFEVNRDLKTDGKLRMKVNEVLGKINRKFEGKIAIKSILRVLYEDIGLDGIRKHVEAPFENAKVAVHYGCHILPELEDFDDIKNPRSLKELVGVLGAEAVAYPSEMTCCAAFARPINEDFALEFVKEKLNDIANAEAEYLVVLCPYCFLQFDVGQAVLARNLHRNFKIPVLYYPQLLGLAMGFEPRQMGLEFHAIKVCSFFE